MKRALPSQSERIKPPCLFPLSDGQRCCECSTCHSYSWSPTAQRDDAIEALQHVRDERDRYRALLERAVDRLSTQALWREHSESGCNVCGARAFNYDRVHHGDSCALVLARAALDEELKP